MLKIMEAFSNAREYCEVGLCVNASNLFPPLLASHKNPILAYLTK